MMIHTKSEQHRLYPFMKIIFAALLIATPGFVNAQSTGPYVGLGVGHSMVDISTRELTRVIQASGYNVNRLQRDDNDYNFKLAAGYQFSPFFAIEANYFDLGSFNVDSTLTPTATQQGELKHIDGLAVNLIGSIPIRDKLSAFATLGLNNASVDQRFKGDSVSAGLRNRSTNGWNENYGVGLTYAIDDVVSIRATLERYAIEKILLWMTGLIRCHSVSRLISE